MRRPRKKNFMEKNKIKGERLREVNQIFEEKGWEKDTDNNLSLYNRAVDTINQLNEEESKFFINLLNNFADYNLKDYMNNLFKALLKVKEVLTYSGSHDINSPLYIAPLVKVYQEEDNVSDERKYHIREFKLNSSSFLFYLTKSKYLQYNDSISELNIVVNEEVERSSFINKLKKSKGKLVLIDDFSGTGKSVTESLEYYLRGSYINERDIFIIILTYTKLAKEAITEKYPDCNFIGIDECCTINDLYDDEGKMTETLVKINNKLGLPVKQDDPYLLGFENSGVLISMLRTPNNTISTFWKEKKKGKYNAIFPRY